jgi:hypothetical protein
MNPNSNESGLNLPPPVSEQLPEVELPPAEAAETKAPAETGAEQSAGRTQTPQPPAIQLPVLPTTPDPTTGAAQPAVSGTTTSDATVTADDTDLIEKEWVDKAKQIVERNREDPYRQSEELTVVKADYMQKRYGKTIKASK